MNKPKFTDPSEDKDNYYVSNFLNIIIFIFFYNKIIDNGSSRRSKINSKRFIQKI